MRRQNLALVMAAVADAGPLSRAAVAGRTGLTRAAVSSLVDELMTAGLVAERGPAPSGRVGRPGSALGPDPAGPAGLGLEVGVRHLAACLVDLTGTVRATARADHAPQDRDPADVLRQLADMAQELMDSHPSPTAGAALAVPGLVTPDGVVAHAPNLGWRQVPAAALLAERLPGVPLTVDNEANLGAQAERWLGTGCADAVHVSAEAGIGAALLVGGRLFRGVRGFAGELGHVPVHPDGEPCACGSRGCLERYAGAAAVVRAAGLREPAGDRVADLARRAARGEEPVLAALERAGVALGTALAGVVNLVDPAAVVLGGAYAELGDWLLPGMRREIRARVAVRPWDPGALTVSALGRRGPVLGAAMLTVRGVIEDPARYASAVAAR
ncbi:ROK family transcriptional regulator [Streptantibioticus silvisoli]|uniref:ROK family transcriptional regulator n=1 Tax=Streptantibioticus silvisoli TaxID=2705255 RepID=A0ABT6VWZ6_9ACTN|nr:ROK family transcriptional regulator [Streptantibioticus silvisoli]MDI5961791.1 ROK family transcriptional regulator [Streptantibioticus silvisoli]